MPYDDDMDRVIDLLKLATEAIPPEYFRLPTAGTVTEMWRERVYCYELYHQLRCRWTDDLNQSLGGEVDKRGHSEFNGTDAANKIPDLIVHLPGTMEENVAVIEVKPTTRLQEISKDVRTLKFFRLDARYQAGILLLFGPDRSPWEKIKSAAAEEDVSLDDLIILHHAEAGTSAERITIP